MPLRMVADATARMVGVGDDEAYRRRLTVLLSNFVRDVARYFNHADRPASVRAYLADSIIAYQPRVVIAHSLGSVVAYETFHEYPHLNVEALVTVGSPLALPGAIFDRLMPAPSRESGKGIGLTNVLSWINLADIGDIVAIPRSLHRYFVGLSPEKDFEINMGFARVHGFSHYLRSASVGMVVHSLVGL